MLWVITETQTGHLSVTPDCQVRGIHFGQDRALTQSVFPAVLFKDVLCTLPLW